MISVVSVWSVKSTTQQDKSQRERERGGKGGEGREMRVGKKASMAILALGGGGLCCLVYGTIIQGRLITTLQRDYFCNWTVILFQEMEYHATRILSTTVCV